MACYRGLACCNAEGQWESLQVGQSTTGSERWGRMAFDNEGRLWVTHLGSGGLALRTGQTFKRLTAEADGLPSDTQRDIACDHEGRIWLGTHSGLYQLAGGEWSEVTLPEPLADCGRGMAVAVAPDGAAWAAVSSGNPTVGGIVRFQGEDTSVHLPTPELPLGRVWDLVAARSGEVWCATDYGAARLDREGNWRMFTSINSGLVCNLVMGLAEDSRGRIWFATAQGVSCYDPRRQ